MLDARSRRSRSTLAAHGAAEEIAAIAVFADLDIERVVGERQEGDIFGEVPIVLGTVFPVGFRAAEKSRVMRIEPHDYHSVAAVAPDVGREIGKLAGHRMAGSRVL